jgi:tape measure domain-containing protein
MSSLVFRITGDPASFKAAMGEVSGALDATGRKATLVSDTFARMGSAMTLGVTVPAIAAGAAVVKAAADMDSLKRGLTAVAGSSGEAEKQLVRLKEVAKLPGLGFKEAIQGSINLQAAGFSAVLAERSLKAFGNALATVGKGKADLDGVGLALSQIASKGKISAEEINQLNERVPQIRAAMKAAFGTADTEVLQKAGIGAQEFVEKVVRELEKLPQVTGGVKNAMENLADAVNQSAVRIGEKLLPTVEAVLPKLEQAAGFAADLVDGFTKLPGPIQDTAIAFGILTIAAGPLSTIAANIMKLRTGVIALTTALGAIPTAITVGVTMVVTSAIRDFPDIAKELNPENWNDKAFQSFTGRSREMETSIKALNSAIGGLKGAPSTFQILADSTGVLRSKVIGLGDSAVTAKKGMDALANVIKVTSVAARDANGELSKTSLVYVEMLERVKSSVSKVKDVMYEYITAGTLVGKTIETHPAILDAATLGAQEYAARLGDIRRELENMPAPRVETVNGDNLRRGSVFETDDILGSSSSRNQAARVAQAEADLARIKQLNAEGKATGNDVITAQQNLKKALEETGRAATTSGARQVGALRQVSTILTDLSRGIANAGVGLLFDRPKVDAQAYRDEIKGLEADVQRLTAAQGQMSEETARLKDEESKLLAAQLKGHNVTAQLGVVRAKILESEKKGSEQLAEAQKKLADANKRMADELHKASFGFRALEAGKAIVEDLAKSIVRTLIEGALTQLAKKLFDVGGIMGKVFGGGSSGPGGSIFSAASSGGGGVASGAMGSVGSAASSGITAVVGAVSGVVSAISGVVSNFQFAHMNTALGRIEESTRYLKIYTGEQSQNLLWCAQKSTEFLGYITANTDTIGRLNSEMLGHLQRLTSGGSVAPMAAEGNISVSMEGAYLMSDFQMGDFADRLIRLLKSRGVQFA